MNKYIKTTIVSAITALAITGCGSSGSSIEGTETGTFVDSPVANLEYRTSSGITGITDANGKFNYRTGDKVSFFLSKIALGECEPDPNNDGLVTPAKLSGGNIEVETLMLQVLQSLDVDNDPTNGITIPNDVVEALNSDLDNTVDFSSLSTNELLTIKPLAEEIDEDYNGVIDVNPTQAMTHHNNSIQAWNSGVRFDSGYNTNHTQHNNNFDINNYPKTENLSQDIKDALAYMGNEERLAHDVYLNLYNYHKNNGTDIYQLYNIATRSESTHAQIVQSLVKRYNLTENDLTDVTTPVAPVEDRDSIDNLPMGKYDIPAIQNLYDALYAKGINSQQDALEVGCMVEVTDINDLDEKITQAEESNATDVVEAFKVLRNGSYNHYWAFDNGLKSIGVSDGCCSIGTVDGVNYCKTEDEYPKNSHESTTQQGQGTSHSNGRHGR